MEKDEGPSSGDLADVRTTTSRNPGKRIIYRWLIGWLVVLGILIIPATLGQPAPLVLYVGFTPFAMLPIRLMYLRRARKSERQVADEEFDAQWENRRHHHEDILNTARRDYSKSLAGRWRIAYGVRHMHGGPTVGQKRIIEFKDDGNGCYQALDVSGLDIPVRVVFMFKPAGKPLHMLVKLVEPALEGWHEVEFDFEVRTHGDEPKLLLWIEGENPMPEDVAELWPFQGEFLQEPK